MQPWIHKERLERVRFHKVTEQTSQTEAQGSSGSFQRYRSSPLPMGTGWQGLRSNAYRAELEKNSRAVLVWAAAGTGRTQRDAYEKIAKKGKEHELIGAARAAFLFCFDRQSEQRMVACTAEIIQHELNQRLKPTSARNLYLPAGSRNGGLTKPPGSWRA